MLSKFKPESNRDSSFQASGASQGAFSVIGADVVVLGGLSSKGDLHIDGRVEGDVTCVKLTLGETGHVAGAITVQDAQISGEVNGPITARNLVLEKVARIKGDITYENMSMHTGASIEGQLARRTADANLTLIAAE